MSNRFDLRRLFYIFLILVAAGLLLGLAEAGLRILIGYQYPGPVIGAPLGLLAVYLLVNWRVDKNESK